MKLRPKLNTRTRSRCTYIQRCDTGRRRRRRTKASRFPLLLPGGGCCQFLLPPQGNRLDHSNAADNRHGLRAAATRGRRLRLLLLRGRAARRHAPGAGPHAAAGAAGLRARVPRPPRRRCGGPAPVAAPHRGAAAQPPGHGRGAPRADGQGGREAPLAPPPRVPPRLRRRPAPRRPAQPRRHRGKGDAPSCA